MSEGTVIDIVVGAMLIAAKLAGPVLVACLVIGIVVAFVQTITQIQEMTLSFVPKLVGAVLVAIVGGRWMIHQVVAWVRDLWEMIPTL
ncbi:MAG TPA: flagellar biosynthetic protein FliQ [Actinomycetota bacterium]|nr:flagellar biosynthetic protein FliQ [Actinomycetota bacterium]